MSRNDQLTEPNISAVMEKRRSAVVLAVMSPKPTVEMVVIAQ